MFQREVKQLEVSCEILFCFLNVESLVGDCFLFFVKLYRKVVSIRVRTIVQLVTKYNLLQPKFYHSPIQIMLVLLGTLFNTNYITLQQQCTTYSLVSFRYNKINNFFLTPFVSFPIFCILFSFLIIRSCKCSRFIFCRNHINSTRLHPVLFAHWLSCG